MSPQPPDATGREAPASSRRALVAWLGTTGLVAGAAGLLAYLADHRVTGLGLTSGGAIVVAPELAGLELRPTAGAR